MPEFRKNVLFLQFHITSGREKKIRVIYFWCVIVAPCWLCTKYNRKCIETNKVHCISIEQRGTLLVFVVVVRRLPEGKRNRGKQSSSSEQYIIILLLLSKKKYMLPWGRFPNNNVFCCGYWKGLFLTMLTTLY